MESIYFYTALFKSAFGRIHVESFCILLYKTCVIAVTVRYQASIHLAYIAL